MKLPETLSVPTEEQETLISWSRNDEKVKVYTSDNTVLTKLKKLSEAAPDKYKLVSVVNNQDGSAYSVTFEVNKKCVSLRQGKEREYTEEQKQEMLERMSALRNRKG